MQDKDIPQINFESQINLFFTWSFQQQSTESNFPNNFKKHMYFLHIKSIEEIKNQIIYL